MSDYYGSIEHQINLMLDMEEDAAKEREKVLEALRDGRYGDVLLPEGDPDEIDDYVKCPETTDMRDACEHGLYWTCGVRSDVWYHLNEDTCLWEVCDEDDIERCIKKGMSLTQPINGLS